MSENRNEANTTNDHTPSLVNLLLFIETMVAELKSVATDNAWTGTGVKHYAKHAISNLVFMACAIEYLTGVTSWVDEDRSARPRWGDLIKTLPAPPQLPEHWLKGGLSEGLSPEDAEFIMNMDR